jgi:hypothetical protein
MDLRIKEMEIEKLLEQIEIAEAELEEQKETKLQYERDEAEGGDWADELTEIRVDIMGTERNLRNLRDRLKREHNVMTTLEFKTWLESFYPHRFCSIIHLNTDDIGIALIVGEGLGGNWGSGSFIVHWTNGESSTIDDEDYIRIVNSDLIGHHTDEDGNELEDA